MQLSEYVSDQIWLKDYPIRYAGCRFDARMTVLRLADARLMLHSPCAIDTELKEELTSLGEVAFIVAPGNYHYFHVASAQVAFPAAETYICPGIERKIPEIRFDWFLGDRPPEVWAASLDQSLVRGTRFIWEVAFYHKPSRTLLLVDLIENIGDQTANVNCVLKFWWKCIYRMWNRPKPAPEYQMGWKDKAAAKKSLQRILEWDIERIILAHGDTIEQEAKAAALEAWKVPLSE